LRDFKKNSYYILTGEEREEKQKTKTMFSPFCLLIFYKLLQTDREWFFDFAWENKKERKTRALLKTKSKKVHKNLQKVKLRKTLNFMDILKLPASALHTTTIYIL
jgi:hypothetical protein